MCDCLVDEHKIVIGHQHIQSCLSHGETAKLVEAATIGDVIHTVIGTRDYRGGEPMPMNGKQCSRILNHADTILEILDSYNLFSRAKKVLAWHLAMLFVFFPSPTFNIYNFLDLPEPFNL